MKDQEMTIKEIGKKYKETRNEYYFTLLFNKIQKSLFDYIKNRVYDKDKAWEILGGTMTKAYQKIHQYNTDYSISTWIYKIAHNNCLQYLYKNNREMKMGGFSDFGDVHMGKYNISRLGLVDENDYEKFTDLTQKEQDLKQDYERIKSLIQETGDKYQDILMDNLIRNLDYEEIENIYGISKQTVKNRLHRGKKKLYQLYNKKYGKKETV